MLVYNQREAAKVEGATITAKPSKTAPLLPDWVQATLNNENENFDKWNRETVSRRVWVLITILTDNRYY